MQKNNTLFKPHHKIKVMPSKSKEIRLSPLTPEPLSLSSSEEMASFGMILLMGGGLSSLLEILGESSLVLLSELSGVLVVG